MLGHKQREIGVSCLALRILIAVSVHCHNTIGVFIDHYAFGIHAERADKISVLLRAVDDLALIQLICQMGENFGRQLHAHSDVNAVGLGPDVERAAYRFHPFTAASTGGDHALAALIHLVPASDRKSVFCLFNILYRFVKIEIHPVL